MLNAFRHLIWLHTEVIMIRGKLGIQCSTLPVPIGAFKHWLARNDTEDDDSADVEDNRTDTDTDEDVPSFADRQVVRWRGAETKPENIASDPAKIQPGDVAIPINSTILVNHDT